MVLVLILLGKFFCPLESSMGIICGQLLIFQIGASNLSVHTIAN
jgi:hypothetical protein